MNFYRLIVFDFDDTIFLKRIDDFIPHFEKLLKFLKNKYHLDIGIISYNPKIYQHIFYYKDYFKFIHVESVDKSIFLHNIMKSEGYSHREILFFDNDPYNVYTISKLNVISFLVNPIQGLDQQLLNIILKNNKHEISTLINQYKLYLCNILNYIERSRLVQNIIEMEKILYN